MIRRLLIANRGEIAIRIARGARETGHLAGRRVLRRRRARAVSRRRWTHRCASAPVRQPSRTSTARRSSPPRRRCGADAIHPGYGFLSERAPFAQLVVDAASSSSGPTPDAIAAMGSKIEAKRRVRAFGVPGRARLRRRRSERRARCARRRERIGTPVLIKASAGGGGRGMRVVDDLAAFDEALASAKREARAAFGDDAVLLERYLRRPRHVEFQILGRRARHDAAPRRARVLDPAPPSESDRGGAERRARSRAARAHGRSGGQRRAQRRLHERGHRRVHARRRRRVLLPRDERAAAGRAPGHGARVRRRPRARAAAHRERGAAALHAGRRRAARLGDRSAAERRGSRARLPAAVGHDRRVRRAARAGRPARRGLPCRRRGAGVLRLAAREDHRVGREPRRRGRAPAPGRCARRRSPASRRTCRCCARSPATTRSAPATRRRAFSTSGCRRIALARARRRRRRRSARVAGAMLARGAAWRPAGVGVPLAFAIGGTHVRAHATFDGDAWTARAAT